MGNLEVCENPILDTDQELLSVSKNSEEFLFLSEQEVAVNSLIEGLGYEFSICSNVNQDDFQIILKNTTNGTLVTIPVNGPNSVIGKASDYIISAIQDGEPQDLENGELQELIDKKIEILHR